MAVWAEGVWAEGVWATGVWAEDAGGGDVTAPTLQAATIAADGNSVTLSFDEVVTFGAGGNGGFTVSLSGGAATLSYSSGDGNLSLVYSTSRQIDGDETGTISYVQPGDGVEDTAGNDLASFSDESLTNSSEIGLTGAFRRGYVRDMALDMARAMSRNGAN